MAQPSLPRYLLRVLGPVTVTAAGDPPSSSRVSQPRQLALLCYLALARPRGLHARDTLIATLWPDASEQGGRQALRNALYAIRQRLGPSAIVSVGDSLIGLDENVVTCDARDLERAEAVVDAGIEPFAGLHVTGALEFTHWLDGERQRLAALLRDRGAVSNGRSVVAAKPTRLRLHAPDAIAMYMRGHYLFLRAAPGGSADDLFRSRECFERALAMDATFAPAIAGLANFHAVAARRGLLTPFEEVFGSCIALSEQATRMDPALAIPHVHFGVKALYLDGDWDLAGREFSLAARLEPDYAEGRRFYGVWLGLVRRHVDALREMEAAGHLEPDIPHIMSSVAAARLAVGDRAGAEEALRRTLALDPRHGPARERLLRLLEGDGRFAEALEEAGRAPAHVDHEALRLGWERAGEEGYRRAREESWRRAATVLEARLAARRAPTAADWFAPPILELATLYARLGEWKRVKECRLRAIAERPTLARWFDATAELEPAPARV